MDSLEEMLNNIYHNFINLNNKLNHNSSSIENLEEVLDSIDKYDNQLKNIHKIISSIDNIQNQVKILYTNKIKQIKNNIIHNTPLKELDYKIDIVNITNNEKYKNKKHCQLPVIIISKNSINDILNTPIYLIKETNEYCIKINNKIIKGNIGNIVTNKIENKIRKCNRLYCNNKFYNKECKFYHEENDIRNFPLYSWHFIYKKKIGNVKHKNNSLNLQNYDIENTRFIGSLDSLNEDLIYSSEYEKKLRNNQLMHDILLYQILDQYLQ